ncbi:hypothetical protein ACFPFP_41520 [Bradyrhizobium sp. GCM10023182]|uniref:Chromosome partitioning protein ParB n=1 Tax=Bradyrhizobium zhengyangense TaxID=2911009 RepID=A0ABS9M237_9BRAD|nr:hypothetical protein [Bradyrhizobium zhengyangense]MCG2673325.1 hypothetical protein [Bradyrhizobium zhengyangense]
MPKKAERLLDSAGRPPHLVDPNAAPLEQRGEAGALPEFRADDEDRENAGDYGPQQLDAAE